MKHSKYNPPDSHYSDYCREENCGLPVYPCPKCGHNGHPNFWKHDEENMHPVIMHGHFLPNRDIGRNVNCKIGNARYCPKEMRHYTWRMIQDMERWLKIPREQKDAMGWA